jgi:uncharacterized protein (UPF0332 family)/predicted nucleotidyltransferase
MKRISKKLRKFAIETRLKSVRAFKDKLLEMFKDYIKTVIIWGAITRGDLSGKSDVDVYILFDDTRMPLKKFNDIRDRIDRDVYKIASSIDPRLHPQPVIALTEFYQNIRACNPFIFNVLREGYAVYDTGFFIPMRKLLEKGEFPVTPEAAEMRMEFVPKRIARVKSVKLLMVVDDLYQAMVDSAQAVLMYLGFAPPAPKVLVRDVRRHLVETGLLANKYAVALDEMIKLRKKSERKDIKTLSGAEVDAWITRTQDFTAKMAELLKKLEIDRKAADIQRNYEVMIKASVAALKALNKLPPKPEKLPEAFKRYLIEPGLVSPVYADVFGKILEMRKLLEEKKLEVIPERDVSMSKEYVRRFIADVRRIIETAVKEKEVKT